MRLGLHNHSSGKVRRVLLVFVLALCLPAFAADKEELLKNGRALVDGIWTNWMQMPKLTYDRITTNKLKSLYGQWNGSYKDDANTRQTVDFLLNADGTWKSQQVRPDMADGHWYLCDGLLLLYEHPVSEDIDVEFAVIMRRGVLRILNADAPNGYLQLERKSKPEPDGAANRNQPAPSKTSRLPAATGPGR